MEDLYAILECPPNASQDEIKQAARKARLKFHPDKNPNTSTNQFANVEKAWYVLGSSLRRAAYDQMFYHYQIMSRSSGYPVQADLLIDEFQIDQNDSGEQMFWSPCRCGGAYVLDRLAVLCASEFAKCTDCSLNVRIKYPSDSQPKVCVPSMDLNMDDDSVS